jgi:hypothetical protein
MRSSKGLSCFLQLSLPAHQMPTVLHKFCTSAVDLSCMSMEQIILCTVVRETADVPVSGELSIWQVSAGLGAVSDY